MPICNYGHRQGVSPKPWLVPVLLQRGDPQGHALHGQQQPLEKPFSSQGSAATQHFEGLSLMLRKCLVLIFILLMSAGM